VDPNCTIVAYGAGRRGPARPAGSSARSRSGDRIASYFALLKTTSAAVRAKHPDVKLAGPALAIISNWQNWFTRFADLGGLDYVDAVTIHPYVLPNDPEASVAYVDTIKSIMAAHGSSKPIYISEQGWATGTSSLAVSELAQARDLVRGQLLSFADGVSRYSVYNFMDSSTDPSNVEHRFGLVRNLLDSRGALVPKPSYVATAVLARAIDELPLMGETKFGTGGHDVAFNAGGGASVHALWSTTPGLVSVAAPAGSTVQVTNLRRDHHADRGRGRPHLGLHRTRPGLPARRDRRSCRLKPVRPRSHARDRRRSGQRHPHVHQL
jgi:hypothetical protein